MKGTVEAELNLLFPISRIREFHRGSAGLYRLFEVLRDLRGPGEIVVPNLCCETVALAARYAGHTVRFADVDGERFCLTPQSVSDVIGPLTRAVVVVHLFGLTTDASAFSKVRKANPEIVFVEDVAHAAGGYDSSGREVGSGFDHVMFSFSNSKILRGAGGAIVSHREDEVTARFHEGDNGGVALEADPLLSVSLRNLVHAIADLHRAGASDAGNKISPLLWDYYRPLLTNGARFLGAERAVTDLRDRAAIRERRHNRAERYREEIRHSGIWMPHYSTGETCWRFPLIAESSALRRRATEALRREGLHASNHYFPLNKIFSSEDLPESQSVGDRILNLWVDDTTSDSQITTAARVLNSL